MQANNKPAAKKNTAKVTPFEKAIGTMCYPTRRAAKPVARSFGRQSYVD